MMSMQLTAVIISSILYASCWAQDVITCSCSSGTDIGATCTCECDDGTACTTGDQIEIEITKACPGTAINPLTECPATADPCDYPQCDPATDTECTSQPCTTQDDPVGFCPFDPCFCIQTGDTGCPDLACCSSDATCFEGRCCIDTGDMSCSMDGDCCNSAATCSDDSKCCLPLGGSTCEEDGDCCDAGASCPDGTCCVSFGSSCTDAGQCCEPGSSCVGPSPEQQVCCKSLPNQACDSTADCCQPGDDEIFCLDGLCRVACDKVPTEPAFCSVAGGCGDGCGAICFKKCEEIYGCTCDANPQGVPESFCKGGGLNSVCRLYDGPPCCVCDDVDSAAVCSGPDVNCSC